MPAHLITKEMPWFDMYAHSVKEIEGGKLRYGTGLNVKITEGYAGLITPHPNLVDRDLICIDTTVWRTPECSGEVFITFRTMYNCDEERGEGNYYRPGDTICRLMIIEIPKGNLLEVLT